ncbi:Rpn family recombination-promoting nuclease/putative transposase [Limosilactobacillus sp. STM2_1]|uniref:Rpn family recombination-promoting nuclease/putative transposase n=2 Tax=Limosilactobacillus rudii TaxID=2759755 RepID=A0A7W3UL11_9LACO|nr:Rpn family recombination-promoting nuclease/putative transposase [Limosilactobacillus rudii]MBB1097512.1 Rpn family recombination-promoting nuclease/putative transposase [Limosilactobacillus rudii]
MFGMVMENKEICLELINRALPKLKAQKIIHLVTQKDVNAVGAHRVRFDVYVRDEHNNIIVIEMQITDQQNLPSRLRYYQEQIDHGLLRPSDDYRVLAKYPTYVIMFCDFDYFGRGWARYEFELNCTRDHNLKFGDQRTIVVFNALAKEFIDDDKPIKNFLALMRNQGDNKDRFIEQIQAEIDKVKRDPERRQGFMKYEMLMMDAQRKAREKGREEGFKDGKNSGRLEERTKGIKHLISSLQKLNVDPTVIRQELKEQYNLTEQEITAYLN